MEPKVSVIVPVYNAEKHLKQCLDSICDQTLKEIEIICVDDGSTDSSPEILEQFRQKDPRIQIFHQQNLYAGIARNTGKAHARGEYLAFWDSDDYFFATALEKMYRKAIEDDADICVCNGKQFFEDKGIETVGGRYLTKKYLPSTCPFNRVTHPLYILNFTNVAPWTKIFRRSYIEKLQLDFQGVRNGNDVYFVECALAQAERITIVDEPLVCYRRNQSSNLVGTLSVSPQATVQTWIDVYDTLTQKGVLPRQSFINRMADILAYVLRNMSFDWNAFRSTVIYLKQEVFPYIGITSELGKDYFYAPWHFDFIQHLLSDMPEDFMAYLLHFTYITYTASSSNGQDFKEKYNISRKENGIVKEDNTELKAELETAHEDIASLKNEVEGLHKTNAEIASECHKLELEQMDLQQKNTKLQKKIEEIYQSRSYRVGHALLWLPRKIKRLFSK